MIAKLFLLLGVILAGASCYKILVFSPTISRSHMISNARIADVLAKDGHNVTLLEVEYDVSPDDVETAKVARRLKVFGPFKPQGEWMEAIIESAFRKESLLNEAFSLYDLTAHHFGPVLAEACDAFLRRHDIIEQLRAEQFDVYMGEQLTLCGSGYSRVLGIKSHVMISSGPIMEHHASAIGIPIQASYVPAYYADFADRMTYGQRLRNLLLASASQYGFRAVYDAETEVFRKHFGRDFAHLNDIVKDSPLTFINVDELTDFPRPILHNNVFIGGLGSAGSSAKPLSEPFISVMTKGKEGVVLVSLGSVVPTRFLPSDVGKNLIRALAELPQYQFILKADKQDQKTLELAKAYPNIYVTSWAPQPSLLAHPRLRAFVTHGGYNSLIESARSGVPLLLMGFFGDQARNAQLVQRNGWGIAFDKLSLMRSHVEFRDAIKNLVTDDSYAQNATRTQKLIKSKPFAAEERLTKYMRFLEANDGRLPELMSEGRNLDFIAFYNLDIYLPLLLVLTTLIFMVFRVVRCAIARVLRRLSKSSVADKKKVQ